MIFIGGIKSENTSTAGKKSIPIEALRILSLVNAFGGLYYVVGETWEVA